MRPTERAANLRRARRRTLFAANAGPTQAGVGPEPESAPEVTAVTAPEATEVTAVADEAPPVLVAPVATAEFALEEFVIDDEDYPEVTFAQRRVAPAASAPDRVDDIDDWLEEFAVADGLDALPY